MEIKHIIFITAFLTIPTVSFADSPSNADPKHLVEQGRAAGMKAASNVPLYPLPFYPLSADFTVGGVNSLTTHEQELFRVGFTKGLSTKLGEHVGWKYGLAAATPATPSLGYEAPIVGELLKNMIIVGYNVNVNPNYALSTISEADLLFVVKSDGINKATTPYELLKHIRGVYPAIELPATFTPQVIPDATGPRSGADGVLRVMNVGARLFVRGDKMISISNSQERSLGEWEAILNGGLQIQDLLVRNNGTFLSGTGGAIKHLDNLQRMISDLNSKGIKLKPGDIVSPGTAVAVRISNGTEQSFTVTYGNLDPQGQVIMNVNFTPDGLTKAQKPEKKHKY